MGRHRPDRMSPETGVRSVPDFFTQARQQLAELICRTHQLLLGGSGRLVKTEGEAGSPEADEQNEKI